MGHRTGGETLRGGCMRAHLATEGTCGVGSRALINCPSTWTIISNIKLNCDWKKTFPIPGTYLQDGKHLFLPLLFPFFLPFLILTKSSPVWLFLCFSHSFFFCSFLWLFFMPSILYYKVQCVCVWPGPHFWDLTFSHGQDSIHLFLVLCWLVLLEGVIRNPTHTTPKGCFHSY